MRHTRVDLKLRQNDGRHSILPTYQRCQFFILDIVKTDQHTSGLLPFTFCFLTALWSS